MIKPLLCITEMDLKQYRLAINSAMFEHVLDRTQIPAPDFEGRCNGLYRLMLVFFILYGNVFLPLAVARILCVYRAFVSQC